MRRLSVSAVILLTAVVIGCGPGKELPDAVPRPKEVVGPASDPHGTAPTTSDPEAKAVVDRAIKAITENDPTRLAKAKTAKVVYQGAIQRRELRDMSKATRTLETVWPSFALEVDDYKGEFLNTTFVLRNQHGWLKIGPTIGDLNSADVSRAIRTDLTAWHWMLLGLPLADPKAVAFAPTKSPAGTVVKVALPNLPVYAVTFDSTSGLPVKCESNPLENNVRVRKVFTLANHQLAGGLMLPTKIEFTQDDTLAERWGQPAWEFPDSIDPSRFEQPK